MYTKTSIQFSELHTAFQAWFAQGHTRFVAPIDHGNFKGCVLYVAPHPDEEMELKAVIRYTLRDEQGIIVARNELQANVREWPLEDAVNTKILHTVVQCLLGANVPTPISTRTEPLDFN